MSLYFITIILLTIFWSAFSLAGIIHVPGDQPSIQAGINAAVNGDTVLVADSTYYENINFKGKAITVASYMILDHDAIHRDSTIIDGSQPSHADSGSVVFFISGEDTTSIIYGFTITGGSGSIYSINDRVGGGIYCQNSGACIMHNRVIANSVDHTGNSWGGGIGVFPQQNPNPVIIEDNLIESNSIHGENSGLGGGIHIIQGKIINNQIKFNVCSAVSYIARGGGIHTGCDTSLQRPLVVVRGNTITYNQAVGNNALAGGGGFDTFGNDIQLESNIISYNNVNAGYCYAPGVNVEYSKEISRIEHNTISFNSPLSGECDTGGLGLYATVGVTVEENHFEGNSAHRGAGFGEYFTSGNVISDNTFIDNESLYFGGGLYVNTSESIISRNKIMRNRASTYNGGGIFIYNCSPRVVNNIITRNKSGSSGGGIYLGGSTSQAQIINNTLVADTAGLYGGGICTNSVSPIVMNTILWDNAAPTGPQIYTISGNTQVHYCDVQDIIWTGEGNINVDPLFVPGDSLYRLMCAIDTSACLNAGIDALQIGDIWYYAPTEDHDGNARPQPTGTTPDMGAWESDVVNSLEEIKDLPVPKSFALEQNYPNPFNPTTVISWQLTVGSPVKLTIYDLIGQWVTTLVNKRLPAGNHSIMFNGSKLASGVYFYKLEAGDFSSTRKMLLVR